MLKEAEWSEDRSYRTGSDNEPFDFYLNGLNNSKSIDLLLGYFSSAAINVLSLGFAKFIHGGGVLRIIVNNILSEEDKEAIKQGQANALENAPIDLRDIRQLKNSLDEYGRHFFQCLSYLISQDRIQIKVVTPKGRKGIVHYKSGIFSDGVDVVGFKASCNFTAFGLLENLEELDAFLSWENSRSSKMIARQRKDFEDIFSGKSEIVNYLDIEDVKVAIKSVFGNPDIEELIIQEDDLIERKERIFDNKKLSKTIEKIHSEMEQIMREPRFPYPSGPREYQIEAYTNWVSNGKKGIFAMATGTGKTLTSLNCLLNEYNENGSYKAIILVPTVALLNQWVKECKQFNFDRIIQVSSKNKWEDEFAYINTAQTYTNISYVVIATYASFSKKKFQDIFKCLSKETLFIADEAHNLGANNLAKLLLFIHLDKRIGLSATPNRKYDDIGNKSLDTFFNDASPYIYSYSMAKALDNGFLCEYKYFPHIVELTDIEFEKYELISKKLLKYLDPKIGKYKDSKEVERLLLERKRIIHKAENKLVEFEKILKTEFENRNGDLSYTLVYVPEGIEPNYLTHDNSSESDDDLRLINQYTKAVSNLDKSIKVSQFTSRIAEREDILKKFQNGKTHVLTSMKCLDEGVDVPRSELAIFCSSSGNPRQFIQRRGRVLRTHKDKIFAVLHDLVVIPKISGDDNLFNMEKNMVKGELERVIDFSNLALNKMVTYRELKPILDYYDLSLYK